MRTTRTGHPHMRRAVITLGVSCTLLLIGDPNLGQSSAQTAGTNPNVLTFEDQRCVAAANANGCISCNAVFVPAAGCTASVPAPWSAGACGGANFTGCTGWTNYKCGVEIFCGTGLPTGRNCTQVFNLCQ